MDWNRTKTIFIIVFSILNIFLYWLYVDRQTDVGDMQIIGKTSVEETLELENITYTPIPFTEKDVSYLSAELATFSNEKLKKLSNQTFTMAEKSRLKSYLVKPVKLTNDKDDFEFEEFLEKYVLNGEEYILWKVDEKEQRAVFFQKVKNETIFYSPNAMLILHWNKDKKVTHYEQRMLDEFVSFNHKKDLLSQDDAVASLVTRNYLKPGSTVTQVKSGYSTLVQLTDTQVFAPTWNVEVKLEDGTIENYFINAVEGKVIEFQSDILEEQTE